jgi:hypothetical protein
MPNQRVSLLATLAQHAGKASRADWICTDQRISGASSWRSVQRLQALLDSGSIDLKGGRVHARDPPLSDHFITAIPRYLISACGCAAAIFLQVL